jgi:GNAT superfamily N-acetyltransferase
MRVRIEYLADHPEALPVLRRWFETEWATYYGPGGPGSAKQDLTAYSSRGQLPICVVAYLGERLCGIAALTPDSIRTHRHLGPWAAAGLVPPEFRRRGIGTRLIRALEAMAKERGYPAIYAGTSTATGLLERNGWQLIERVQYHGEDVSIYQKAL